MPPRAISSPSRYRAAGFDTPEGMPTPPARSAAASGSSLVAAGSLVPGGSRRGYSGMAVPSPTLQATRVAVLTHDPAGRRDAAGTGDLRFPQCEAPGRRDRGLVEARGGSPHGAPEPLLEPRRAETRIRPRCEPAAAHHRPVIQGLRVRNHLPFIPARGQESIHELGDGHFLGAGNLDGGVQ